MIAVLAAFAAVGLAVAGVHAAVLLLARRAGQRAHPMHRPALRIALWVGAVASLLQPLSGDYAAKVVARTQPVKLAAMEGQFRTERGAPLRLFGWPDEARGETRYALEIPMLLSVLAHGDPRAEVAGLETVPRDLRPPVLVVHVAPHIAGALLSGVPWLLLLSHGLGLGLLAALSLRRYRLARLLVIALLGGTVLGLGLAQHPYLIYPTYRIAEAHAPAAVLRPVLLVLGLGSLVLGPALGALYLVFKGGQRSKPPV